MLRRGKAIAKKFGLHMKDPMSMIYHLIYALGFGSLVPVLESGTLRILFPGQKSCQA